MIELSICEGHFGAFDEDANFRPALLANWFDI